MPDPTCVYRTVTKYLTENGAAREEEVCEIDVDPAFSELGDPPTVLVSLQNLKRIVRGERL
jgi:hypothetical protein